jgi:hypothetical protein
LHLKNIPEIIRISNKNKDRLTVHIKRTDMKNAFQKKKPVLKVPIVVGKGKKSQKAKFR